MAGVEAVKVVLSAGWTWKTGKHQGMPQAFQKIALSQAISIACILNPIIYPVF